MLRDEHLSLMLTVPIYSYHLYRYTIPVSGCFYTFKICQDYWAWEAKVWAERRSMVIDLEHQRKILTFLELMCLRYLTPRQVSPDRENLHQVYPSEKWFLISYARTTWAKFPLSLENSRHAQRGRLKWCTKIVQGFIGRRVFLPTKSIVLDRFRKAIVLGRFRKVVVLGRFGKVFSFAKPKFNVRTTKGIPRRWGQIDGLGRS